ncbi:MAG: SET domain-containing protein [Cyclobacteriaceae bacterium]|nr:SET domain-containing protein [Cyclobacteriaceae bacterium]
MIHPHTETKYISEIVGYGVVATRRIPAGTITWVKDELDREFPPAEFYALPPVYREIVETYSFRNNKGYFVFCWDHGRFVNHSFKPNCLSTAYGFEVAIRDIAPGEEITNDYGNLNILEPFEPLDEGTDRKIIYPDDLVRHHLQWDQQVASVFDQIPTLDQPLRRMIAPEVWDEINEIATGKMEMKSVLVNYFSEGRDQA